MIIRQVDRQGPQHETPLEGLKVVVNAGNGMGGFLAETLSQVIIGNEGLVVQALVPIADCFSIGMVSVSHGTKVYRLLVYRLYGPLTCGMG